MDRQVNYGGLVVAGIGFFLTRFTVTLAIYEDPLRFYLAGVLPLMLGLGLAAFGIALAVADVAASMVRTTAAWCVAGAGAMSVLVVLTLLGSTSGSLTDLAAMRSQVYLSNFLIGGSVGGTLTGLYASRNRRHRLEIQRQANRLEVLNRLLRHEVLNAVSVIQAYLHSYEGTEARGVIEDRSKAIERTIDEVKYLARTGVSPGPIDLGACLESSVATVNERYPRAEISVEVPSGLTVRATDRLEQVFVHLLENAIHHGGDDTPTVEVTEAEEHVRVAVSDDGDGLSADQRALLETGEIEEFDDPRTGFGLNVVRLFVENFDGSIEVDTGPDGTTITVVLSRVETDASGLRALPTGATGVRPDAPHLIVTLGAALLAGVAYGVASEALGGSIAGIGVFYGTVSPVVGWITHEFHSVVFGFVFAGLISLVPRRYREGALAYATYVVVGLAWAFVLWAVAAGVVAPIWLRLLGIPATIPNLTFTLFVNHVAWGVSIGLLTAWGYEHVTPPLFRLGERLLATRTPETGT